MKNILLFLSFFTLPFAVNAGGGCNSLNVVVSPNGQYLYFSSDRHGGNYEIYRSDLDGISNLVRLTNTSINNWAPAISPDGSKIVFQGGDYGASAEIFIMNANGTGLTQLTTNSSYDGSPNFSPDGQTIVFDAWDVDAYPEIFTMDINGNNRTQITNVPGADWQCSPIYNPSGTFIYFSIGYNADNHLARMDLNGSNIVDITPPNAFGYAEFGMRFSPDAQQIVFSTTEWQGYNNGSDIVIADTLGGNWNRITTSVAGEWFHSPYWHPTNNKFYYSYYSNAAPSWQIYEMSTSGSGMVVLSNCSNVGVTENSAKGNLLSFYPNPATDELNLSLPVGAHAEVYDATGRLVLTSSMNKVDVSALESGFYTLCFVDAENVVLQVSKVVKN